MFPFNLAVALLVALVVQIQGATLSPRHLPGAYIVEYEDGHDGDEVLSTIQSRHDATLRRDLSFELFKGASIQFQDSATAPAQAAKVAKMAAVKKIWPVKLYSVPEHTVHYRGNGLRETAREKRDLVAEKDTFSTHVMTQVDMLHAAGFNGTGIKIGIVDTGTDYLHPALGGCFGPGCLVSYGTDLVGDHFNGSNTPIPDPDPLDNCNGHGTHVAGIIAAQAATNPYGIIGGAPGVTLGSFRVFGCDGDVGNDVLIAAFNLAYEAGSDIITASIGGASGWSEDPWAVAVQRIVEAGVPCTVSAGNDGSSALFYSSTAADGKMVAAVASVDNVLSPALLVNASFRVEGAPGTGGSTRQQSFGFTAGSPGNWTANVTLPLWALSYNTSDPANGCDPFPASTPDLSKYVVLIRRGTCTFTQKAANAFAKGAKYVIYYNNAAGGTTEADASGTNGTVAVAMVTSDQGAAWIDLLKAGEEVVVTMSDPLTASMFLINFNNTETAGLPSSYTSWGPTFEVDVKPQFATPGGNVLSLYPRALGAYAVLSGTSMACPLTAAIYALIMNARGTKDPRTIENLLSATSIPVNFSDGTITVPAPAPVPQQGGGVIQAFDAVHATTLLSVSSISFNDSDHFVPVRNFSFTNTGPTTLVYNLQHIPAVTSFTFANATSITPDTFPPELNHNSATIKISHWSASPFANATSATNITLQPGERRIISLTATPPSGLDPARLPVYSGFIAITSSDGRSYSLPYQGVVGSLRNATVLDPSATVLSGSFDLNASAVPANTTFVLPPAGHVNDTEWHNKTNLPTLYVTLAMGSALVRADVVPVLNGSGSGYGPEPKFGNGSVSVVLGTRTVGQVMDFPVEYNSRGQITVVWDGALAGGGYLAEGMYRLSVKALRIFGRREVREDYDVFETDVFGIRYAKGG